jgi:hypothetical protein
MIGKERKGKKKRTRKGWGEKIEKKGNHRK